MFTTTLFFILLEVQAAPPDPPVPERFTPVRAEVTADEQGIEVLAYDDDGKLVGALIAAPDGDRVRIEANFADGYATIELNHEESDENGLQTDLEKSAAVGRVAEMFAVAFPPEPLEASRKECMWLFAGIAAGCGGAALFPPAGAVTVAGCLFGLGGALCECGKYLPINIC